MSSEMRKRY